MSGGGASAAYMGGLHAAQGTINLSIGWLSKNSNENLAHAHKLKILQLFASALSGKRQFISKSQERKKYPKMLQLDRNTLYPATRS